MQWGVILLLGGGFAIADACKVDCAHYSTLAFLQQWCNLWLNLPYVNAYYHPPSWI